MTFDVMNQIPYKKFNSKNLEPMILNLFKFAVIILRKNLNWLQPL